MASPLYEDAFDLAKGLPVEDQLKLISALATRLVVEGLVSEPPRKPFPSVFGVLKDHGPGPSEEDFAEARRAMWEGLAPEESSR